MNERVRNIAVGLTVIVAIVLLCGMIILFTGLPQLFRGGYIVNIVMKDSGGAAEGDPIQLSGIRVATVESVTFEDPSNLSAGVTVRARVHGHTPLPANMYFTIQSSMFGQAYLQFQLPSQPGAGPVGTLPMDGTATIPGINTGGGGLGPELRPAMESLARLADSIQQLISPPTSPGAATQPGTMPAGLAGTVKRLNQTLDDIDTLVGDPSTQANFKAAMANLAQATSAAGDAMTSLKQFADQARQTAATADDRIDKLATKLFATADDISKVAASVNAMAVKAGSGDGTFGKLLNDPGLYNELLDATRQLQRLSAEAEKMLRQWREQGVPVKL